MANRWGKSLIFLGSRITVDGDYSHEIKRCFLLGRKVMTNLDSVFKSRDIALPTKVSLVKAIIFPVVMYGCELDHQEGWMQKNVCFWTAVLEKTPESPLDCKEIKPVHPKGNQPWLFIGRTYAETETLIFWPPDVKSQLNGKDPDAREDWGQEEKKTTVDETFGWHHCTDSVDMSLSKLWDIVKDKEGWHSAVHGVEKSDTTKLLNNKAAYYT